MVAGGLTVAGAGLLVRWLTYDQLRRARNKDET